MNHTILSGPSFLRFLWFGSSPTTSPFSLSPQQVVSLSQSSSLTGEGEGSYGRGIKTHDREKLALYKAFNPLWFFPSPSVCCYVVERIYGHTFYKATYVRSEANIVKKCNVLCLQFTSTVYCIFCPINISHSNFFPRNIYKLRIQEYLYFQEHRRAKRKMGRQKCAEDRQNLWVR